MRRSFYIHSIALNRLKSVRSSTLKNPQNLFRKGSSTGRVLPSQKLPIRRHDSLCSPCGRGLFVEAVGCNVERCLEVERHILLTIDIDFFLVTEASNPVALE